MPGHFSPRSLVLCGWSVGVAHRAPKTIKCFFTCDRKLVILCSCDHKLVKFLLKEQILYVVALRKCLRRKQSLSTVYSFTTQRTAHYSTQAIWIQEMPLPTEINLMLVLFSPIPICRQFVTYSIKEPETHKHLATWL